MSVLRVRNCRGMSGIVCGPSDTAARHGGSTSPPIVIADPTSICRDEACGLVLGPSSRANESD